MTALGGEAAKDIFRAGTGSKIVEDDCGSTFGIPLWVGVKSASRYVGNAMVKDGKTISITKENLDLVSDKWIVLRSPAYCQSVGGTCVTCTGEFIRGKESSITLLLGEAGSEMMSRFMAKMHGTALQTVKIPMRLAYA